MKPIPLVALIALLLVPSGVTRAESLIAVEIPVPNYSFESGAGTTDDNNWWTDAMINGGTDTDNLLSGWVLYVVTWRFGGRLNPGNDYYANTSDGANPPPNLPSPADNRDCAFLHWGANVGDGNSRITSYQDVATIKKDTDYELRVAVGTPVIPALPQPVTVTRVWVRILANGVMVAVDDSNSGGTPIPDPGTWTDFVVTLDKGTIFTNGLVGQSLKIQMEARMGTGVDKKQVNFDNVRLTKYVPDWGTYIVVR